MKVEPCSVEEIKELAKMYQNVGMEQFYPARLILTWAHERAGRFEAEHRINMHNGEPCDSHIKPRDWLAYVLDEVEWK